MITKLFAATTMGLQAQLIEIETDFSPALPQIVIVGLPDKAVQESKERIRAAIKQSGYEFPLGKITVNLAPADISKTGSSFDLPIAVSILHLTQNIKNQLSEKSLFLGELALDGKTRPVPGILSICLWARENGYEEIFIPKGNSEEGSLVGGIKVYPVESLKQLVDHLNEADQIEPLKPKNLTSLNEKIYENQEIYPNDMAYVRGQKVAKRALEIAASGGHNVLFIGTPGSGKTLLARSYSTILPKMTEEEILEATQVYSAAGLLLDGNVVLDRPFRAPHHSASHVSLVGGGAKIRPGEASLAHRGVLFLDEFPEFSRETVEALRQPLEDGFINISRASGSITFPSRFYLLAAANPTPSGFDPDDRDALNKPQNKGAIMRYQAKFSGPILDRIDLQVEVDRPSKEELQSDELAEPSKEIAKRVQTARDFQTERFAKEKIYTNAEMGLPLVKKYCKLCSDGEKLMSQAIDKFKLSGRGYIRTLKLSRTIADLNGNESIKVSDIAESLQYRGRWG